MKKFIEELNKVNQVYEDTPTDTEAERKIKSMHEKYKALIGKRAFYTSKGVKDARVVTIDGVYNSGVLLSYGYYSTEYSGRMKTSVSFVSLLCSDGDKLEVEE